MLRALRVEERRYYENRSIKDVAGYFTRLRRTPWYIHNTLVRATMQRVYVQTVRDVYIPSGKAKKTRGRLRERREAAARMRAGGEGKGNEDQAKWDDNRLRNPTFTK